MRALFLLFTPVCALALTIALVSAPLYAQDTETPSDAATQTDGTSEALLSPEALQELAAPIALFPDTLLIQVLVAATFPLEVVKADQFLQDNTETDPEALKTAVDAQGWDDSVAVLATAFPDTLTRMADHIDWTEAIGSAMLVQSDDVLDAVQVKRAEADAAGNLESGAEQTVEVTQEDSGEQTIIIQPTDPQVVYVPEYNTETVYVQPDTSTDTSNDALTTALIIFGAAILLDTIFDDDDPWYGYWGCRNCCGWGGRPIYNNPRRVNIGNDGNVLINTGDVNVGWRPEDRRQADARRKLENRRGPDGVTTLPGRVPNRGDDLRRQLRDRSGAADITRPENRNELNQARENVGQRAGNAVAQNRPATEALDRTKRPAAAPKPAPAQRPAARATAPKAQAVKNKAAGANRGGGALRQQAPAARARAGSARGNAARGRVQRGR